MLAADNLPDEAAVADAEPPLDALVDDAPVDATPLDDTPVPKGLLPMKPSEGVSVLLDVPPDDPVDVASELDDVAVVPTANGLERSVIVCVVAYVPPRSSLIVLKAVTPRTSVHCSTVTVSVESVADETAVPCRFCRDKW